MNERRQRRAIHEAGHLRIASLFHLQPVYATIDGDDPGMANDKPDFGVGSIACCLVGATAERLFFGDDVETGDAIDRKRTASFTRMSGMNATAAAELRGIVERTVAAHRERIKFIADNLLLRGTLHAAEIDRLLR